MTEARAIVLSVDAMGGDKGPAIVIAGISRFLSKNPDARVLLHGPEAVLAPLVAKRKIKKKVDICHADDVVKMTDKPSSALRNGKNSSMWSAIESVRNGDAEVCVSCGNTGALMAMSMLRLRKAEGVNRPAIACLWPSQKKDSYNVMLDAGADIRADQDDLLTYAFMGASYARNGLGLKRPRVGLLNVGVEEHKGRAELKSAHEMISKSAQNGDFEYIGFIEGGDMLAERVDVIVTDGFTGNVALKTAEGTANLISSALREAFQASIFSRAAAMLAYPALRLLRKRIDPRRVNGGVFLGLNKTVIKSHGSADPTGIAAALSLAHRLAVSGFSDKLAARVASAAALAQDAHQESDPAEVVGSKGEQTQ